MSPFQRIYDFAIDRCPQLAVKNTFIIHEWLKTGYDLEADIITAIDSATKRGGMSIRSFNYFDGFIRSHNERRLKESAKPEPKNQPEIDAIRAKNLRWLRDNGINTTSLRPEDFTWLEHYEREHPVAL